MVGFCVYPRSYPLLCSSVIGRSENVGAGLSPAAAHTSFYAPLTGLPPLLPPLPSHMLLAGASNITHRPVKCTSTYATAWCAGPAPLTNAPSLYR